MSRESDIPLLLQDCQIFPRVLHFKQPHCLIVSKHSGLTSDLQLELTSLEKVVVMALVEKVGKVPQILLAPSTFTEKTENREKLSYLRLSMQDIGHDHYKSLVCSRHAYKPHPL